MKIISIVGARPEFIQAAPVSQAIRQKHQEILIHTGQHYDYIMSQAFFDELDIPTPDYNLGVGSGSHAQQTAQIMQRLEEVLLQEQPDLMLVRGDTNSTLAGALTASKLAIPIAHIEAGERSYDRRMPEEINRCLTDCLANLHFCVSGAAVERLAREGIVESVHCVGDVMLDALQQNRSVAHEKSTIMAELGLKAKSYSLATIHRAANTDNPAHLTGIAQALQQVQETVVFPAHPRTKAALNNLGIALENTPHVKLIDPVSYFDMMVLAENARLIATDSGGLQREAYFLGIPCLTLRAETEWIETVNVGWNKLVGADTTKILLAWKQFSPQQTKPAIFGDGKAGQKIARVINQIAIKPEHMDVAMPWDIANVTSFQSEGI